MSTTIKKQPLKGKEKKKFYKYSEKALELALFDIRDKKLAVREASRKYGVPRTTIQDRIKGKTTDHVKQTGPQPILTIEGEAKIEQWVLNLAKCGFPIKKSDLMETVTKIARETGKADMFPNKKPGEKWYSGFLKRHPRISLRETEGINKARALVTEEAIRKWFRQLSSYLEENDMTDIMEDPDRIFNGDESGFSLCPKTGKVLAPRGFKNVYTINTGKEKENLTVLIVSNAAGKICPPLVVFPYLRPPRALVEKMPPDWVLGKSESGWMRGEVFFEYVSNDFNKWVEKNNIKRPVILFIDGHRSHMTLSLSEFCEQNQIVLYALPPNTTHLLQPADVSVFKSMKQDWKKTARDWLSRPENINNVITKINFCEVFQSVLNINTMSDNIKKGFKKCGLFPLEPNNVDYSKCVRNTLEQIREEQVSKPNGTKTKFCRNDLVIAKNVVAAIENSLASYGINTQVILNEIDLLETDENYIDKRIENVDISDNPKFQIGSLVSMDDLQVIPVQLEMTQSETQSDFVSSIEHISMDTSNIMTTEKDPNDTHIIIHQNVVVIPANETPNTEGKEKEISDVSSTSGKPEPDDIKSTEIDIDMDVVSNGETDDPECIQSTQDEELMTSKNETPDFKFEPDLELNIEKPKNCEKVLNVINNNNLESTSDDPFDSHLVYPEPIKYKGKENKEMLPSAISCEAWRRYYKNKEENKKIPKKKIQSSVLQKKNKVMKRKSNKKKPNENENREGEKQLTQKEKIKCASCTNELQSDTEEEAEKNIGCDYCPNWYHLKCTTLYGLSYDEAAVKEYKCDVCNM